jgi:hypothetical protein
MSESSKQASAPAKDLDRLLAELGSLTANFKPDLANFVAGIILCVLAVAGGIAILVWMVQFVINRGGDLPWMLPRDKDDLSWFLVGLMVFAGCALALLGFEFLQRARRVQFFHLFICRDGFVTVEKRKAEVFRWDEIALILESVKQEYFPLKMGLKYLFPLGKNHKYLVRSKDGREVQFDREVVPQIEKLKRLLQQEANKRGIEWRSEESYL